MRRVLKKYEEEGKYGKIINKVVKPKHKRSGWVYLTVDEHMYMFHADNFIPTWDETDHLHFVCRKCKSVADILGIDFEDYKTNTPQRFVLYLYFGCPNCGATGMRKIYLGMSDSSCKFQHAYDKGKIYIYGNERKPYLETIVNGRYIDDKFLLNMHRK